MAQVPMQNMQVRPSNPPPRMEQYNPHMMQASEAADSTVELACSASEPAPSADTPAVGEHSPAVLCTSLAADMPTHNAPIVHNCNTAHLRCFVWSSLIVRIRGPLRSRKEFPFQIRYLLLLFFVLLL